MNVHRILHGLRSSGPGVRTMVWLQDYDLWDTTGRHLQSLRPGVTEIEPVELAKKLVGGAAPNTEDILVGGGEPMEQAVDVAALLFRIKALQPQWSTGIVTGYTEAQLRTGQYRLHDRPRVSQALRAKLWVNQMLPLLDYAVFGLKEDPSQADPDPPDTHWARCASRRVVVLSSRYTHTDFFWAA